MPSIVTDYFAVLEQSETAADIRTALEYIELDEAQEETVTTTNY